MHVKLIDYKLKYLKVMKCENLHSNKELYSVTILPFMKRINFMLIMYKIIRKPIDVWCLKLRHFFDKVIEEVHKISLQTFLLWKHLWYMSS